MRRIKTTVILIICAIVFIGCVGIKENETNSSNAGMNEESTYETVSSQKSTESKEPESVLESEDESETGAEPETEGLTGIEAAMQVPEEGLSLMQKVLLDKEEFYGKLECFAETMEKHKVEEYFSFCDYEKDRDYFYVVDMDNDGTDEVCVAYTAVKMMIFHEENGEVYGYEFGIRDLNPLYQDGTFATSDGASRYYLCGNVSFVDNHFSYNAITSVETGYDENRNVVKHYYKDAEPGMEGSIEITKEEYDEIRSRYPKEEAMCYDFTIENILKYVK